MLKWSWYQLVVGGLMFLLSDFSNCLAQLDKTRQRTSQRIAQAQKTFNQRNYKASYNLWHGLYEEDPNNPVYSYNLGNILYELKNYKGAVKYYIRAIKLGGPLSLISRINLSKTYSEVGENERALIVLDELLTMKLPDSLYYSMLDEIDRHANKEDSYFRRGKRAFNLQQYKQAFTYFKLALIITPSSLNYFMAGYSKLKLGKRDEAKEYFQKIKDDKVYADAMKLLGEKEEIDESTLKRLALYFDFQQANNDNPNTEAESATPEADTEIIASLGASYSYVMTDNTIMKLSFDGYLDKFRSDGSTKSTGKTISLPIEIYQKNYNMTLTPKYEFTEYGSEPYVNNSIIYFAHNYYLDGGQLSLTYTYTGYKARDDENYEYLNGYGYFLTYAYTKNFGKRDLTIELQRQEEELADTDDTIGSKHGTGISLYSYQPIWGDSFTFSPSITYFYAKYDPDSDGFEQVDKTLTISVTLNLTLSSSWGIYLSSQYIKNDSNLSDSDDDNNYTQIVNGLGVSWYNSF